MKSEFFASLLLVGVAGMSAMAQTPVNPPAPAASPTPLISEELSKILESVKPNSSASREQRELAYAKLLEGQRYIWSGDRLRSRAGRQHNAQMAKDAFKKSVELDPTLSEGYTALAELAINSQPQDADEAIRLAHLATKVNPNSFGAHRILGRLYTFKSRVGGGPFDSKAGNEAITEWRHVTRLDPRNAEGWAILSDLYEKLGNTNESIEALRNWISAAPPVDTRFYQMLMAGQNLAPENASTKLGSSLLKAGRTREAVETLSQLIADDSDNLAVFELLRDA